MLRAMYAAISGLKDHETMTDIIGSNIANVDTVGYKSQTFDFSDMMSQVISGAGAPSATRGGINPVQVGLGAGTPSIASDNTQGALQETGNTTDLAISGNGYFQLEDGTGTTTLYTRAGDFNFDSAGNLVSPDGYYVMGRTDTNGDGQITSADNITKISVPTTATDIVISQDGTVSYTDTTGATVVAGKLILSSFPDENAMQRVGNNELAATPGSGTATVDFPTNSGLGAIQQGTLEGSNVDLATEFTGLIAAERGFQANAEVITTGDQILQYLANLKQ